MRIETMWKERVLHVFRLNYTQTCAWTKAFIEKGKVTAVLCLRGVTSLWLGNVEAGGGGGYSNGSTALGSVHGGCQPRQSARPLLPQHDLYFTKVKDKKT